MKNTRFLHFSSTFAASLILFTQEVHAAAITWDAGGADNNWSTINNWSDNLDPIGDDVTFNATGALASGITNTVSSSVSIASLTYNIDSSTLQHTTAIAAGQTLAVTGNFLLASSVAATTPTNVTIAGSTGALTVGGTSFQVGQTAPTAASATSTLDMSGLGTLTANLSGVTSTFRLGATSTTSISTSSTLKLAGTNTITANTLGVGDTSGGGATHTLKLGSVSNTINANFVNVGSRSGRASGNISFNTSTGTLLLRAADGTSAVTEMNLVNNSFGHTATHVAVVDFTGHSVDAKIGALNMALRTNTTTNNNGGATSTLSFDTGTLDVGTVTMARNANSLSSATTAATINIGGGTATFAALNMSSSGAGATSTTNSFLNLTGGTTKVTGDILKVGNTGGSTGATNATVLLNGGTLDMDDGNIGSATNLVALDLRSGTLKNVAQINGGGGILKTTTGSLTLSGANTFTGDVTISTGEVVVTESGSLGVGPKVLNPQANGYFTLDGTAGPISLASNMTLNTAGLSVKNIAGANVIHGAISIVAGSSTTTIISDGGSLDLAGNIASGVVTARALELSGTSLGANTVSGDISDGLSTVNLVKSGTGTWTLDGTNTYSGSTNINAGKLVVNGNISTSSLTTVGSDATLAGTGTTGSITVNTDGIFAPGDGGIESLNITGNLTLGIGSFSNFEIDTSGNLADLAIVSALLAFDGTLNVSNIGAALVDGDVFNLFDWGSASGAFNTVNLPTLGGGLAWDQSNLYTNGTIAVVAVPEPGMMSLLGVAGLLVLRRRRSIK